MSELLLRVRPPRPWPRPARAAQKTAAGKVFPLTRCAPSEFSLDAPLAVRWSGGYASVGFVLLQMYGYVSPEHGHHIAKSYLYSLSTDSI